MNAATLPAHLSSLQRRIDAVRQKRTIVRAATGIAAALGLLLGGMAGECVLDALVELPWLARAVALMGAIGGSGWFLWKEAIHPLRRRLSDDAVASMIEHALPAFRTRFIASLQLVRAAGGEAPRSLVHALLAETAAMAATQDFRQVVKTARLRRILAISGSGIAISLLLACVGGASSAILLERALLFNTPLPHKTHILSVTGDKTAGIGEDLEIDVTAAGLLPAEGQIISTTASGQTRQFPLERDADHRGRYSATIRSPQESFSYYVKLNDDTSARYHVRTMLRPAVSAVTCQQIYPAYVHLPPVTRTVGDLSLLAGSRLKIFIKASANIRAAALRLAGLGREAPLAIDPRDPTSLSGEINIPPKDLTGFSVHLVDTAGVESGETATYRIDLVPDRPPTVEITFPTEHEELATPGATLRIAFEAKDDYGVVKALLHYTIDGGAEKTIDFDLGGRSEKDLVRRFDWRLSSLQPPLVIGNALECWITVADGNDATGPGLGTSEHYEFKIVSDEEKRLDIANRLRDTIEGLKDVEQSEEDLNQTIGAPLFEKPKENP
jgi:hypothetical protein